MDELANSIQMMLMRVLVSDEFHNAICEKLDEIMNETDGDEDGKTQNV